MGLLLSILATCVGVIELLTFYHNVKRYVNVEPVRTGLNVVQDEYLRGLENERDRLELKLRNLKNEAVNAPQVQIPTFRLNSHQEIDDQFRDKAVARSRSTSPRRFSITEKNNLSTKKFVVSKEPPTLQGIKKSKAQECIPEYLVEKQSPSGVPVYVNDNEPMSLPLPENLVISEQGKEIKVDVFRKKLGHNITEVDDEFSYRRSPSPSFDLTAPRNSVCSELLEDSVSVAEVDEISRSNSHSPVNAKATCESIIEINNNLEKVNVILNSSTYNSTEYWNNEALADPLKVYKSRSPSPVDFKNFEDNFLLEPNLQKRRSKSESDREDSTSNVQTYSKIDSSVELSKKIEDIEVVKSEKEDGSDGDHILYTEDAKSNLDGLDRNKGCIKKRFIKRKGIKSHPRMTSEKISDSREAINSVEPNVLPPEKKTNSANSSAKSKNTSDIKPGEPFWLIFSGEYTKAMNKDFHGQHFCCWQCDESLTGQRYVLRDDHPYCVSCYESVFANACEKCSRTIGIDSKDLSYKDKHWHEACFLCTTCGESLVDKQFGSKGDRIYCGRCYDEQFASRCDGCHEIFRAGTKKMEYKTRQWHEKCFCCFVCKVPIGTQSFIPREQEIYCAKCYEEKFATRCIKCNKVITSGGVTYKNEPWHRECFTCTNCQKSLAGERFTSRDEKPYCADCFGELFAKRCFACNRPITGIGGTKFISFEDRHWHNDCFFCASCRTSLVGRGFITDQDDIICPECAKQKLM